MAETRVMPYIATDHADRKKTMSADCLVLGHFGGEPETRVAPHIHLHIACYFYIYILYT